MKAATIIVAVEEGQTAEAGGDCEGRAAGSPAATRCQRYYMDHMPLSTVQDVVDSEQYAALCKARLIKTSNLRVWIRPVLRAAEYMAAQLKLRGMRCRASGRLSITPCI